MAGGQERILRRRIKSVESTKKITRAMELIAATRVVKAQERAAAAGPYSAQITAVVQDLVRIGAGGGHPLMAQPESGDALIVAVTSDRGLCGAYNTTVLRMTERAIAEHEAAGRRVRVVAVGKKGLTYLRFRGVELAAHLEGVTDQPTYEDARAIANTFREAFEAGELASVDIVYWQFHSAGSQDAALEPFLPIAADEPAQGEAGDGEPSADVEYEPSPEGILDELLPRYLESRVFAALLDASASEHAARQRAMKAATDNAEELKTNLTRIMNRARQDAITTEIMEIVGGAEALKQGKGSAEDLLADHLVIRDLFPGRESIDHGAGAR